MTTNGEKAIREALDNARVVSEADPVAALNREHALIVIGGKAVVLMDIANASGDREFR